MLNVESDMKTFLLLHLAALLQLLHAEQQNCSDLQHDSLRCLNDYNSNITCVWNSTSVSKGTDMNADAACTIYASRKKRVGKRNLYTYNASCDLEPADVSTPALRKCSLVFKTEHIFKWADELSIYLSCKPLGENLIQITYRPSCNIKMNPPGEPDISYLSNTSVSLSPQIPGISRIPLCSFQLQWKQQNQAWQDAPSKRKDNLPCGSDSQTELDPNLLVRDEMYEARARIMPSEVWYESTWSDWSPTASWKAPIGTTKAPPTGPAPIQVDVLMGKMAGAACALLMVIVVFRMDKTTWFDIVKKLRGPQLPNPANSSLQHFQGRLSPAFASESFQTFLKPVEIMPVEITSSVDAIHCGSEAALQEKMRCKHGYQGTGSSFANPSYSHLCPPCVSSLTAGALEACLPDSPYGPVGGQGEGANTGPDREEEGGKDMEVQHLFSEGSETSESMQVSSDNERVEKLQVQRSRLQSPDSGMCSGEEVSQESLEEADGTSMTDGHDEWSEGKEMGGRNGKGLDFQNLFGNIGCSGIVSKGSIQVCSGYERVERLQPESPVLRSPDSGVGSGAEEQVSQGSPEDVDRSTESSSFLFPPPCSTFPWSMPSFTPMPLDFSGEGLSPALGPLLPCHTLGKIPMTTNNRPMEPSGDGYM